MQEQRAVRSTRKPAGAAAPKARTVQKSVEPVEEEIYTEEIEQEQETEAVRVTAPPQRPAPQAIPLADRQAVTTRSEIPRPQRDIRQSHPDYQVHLDENTEFYEPKRKSSAVQQVQRTSITQVPTRQARQIAKTYTQPRYNAPTPRRAGIQQPQPTVKETSSFRKALYTILIGLVALFIFFLGGYLFTTVPQNLQRWSDDNTYGRPRTFHLSANVGHGGLSDFTATNRNGHIEILEELEGADPKPHLYTITYLAGSDNWTYPVTLSFVDLNHDGKIDMLIDFKGFSIPYYNTGTIFKPQP